MRLDVAIRSRFGDFGMDVAFGLGPGITALFGPSGAGKSLTLRQIAGLARPGEGLIELGGRTLFDDSEGVDLPSRERGVGLVFQHSALFPHLSVGSNVGFGLAGRGRDERRERVREMLRIVELEGYEERAPGSLSGGERRRVAVARALAPGPSLLLLDEPFAGLDFRVRRGLRGRLRSIHLASGVPALLVSHSLADVREICDGLILIDRGRIVAQGSTEEVLRDPGSPEAAELLTEDLG